MFTEQLGKTKKNLRVALRVGIRHFSGQRLAPRLGPDRLVRAGSSLMVAGTLGGAILHHVPGLELTGIVGPQIALTLGGGLLLPATLAGAVLPNPHCAGMAAAFIGSSQMAGGATGDGLALCNFQDGTAEPMLSVQATLALLHREPARASES